MKATRIFSILALCIITSLQSFAQNGNLKRVSDDNWIEYLVPRFMNDVTPYGDNFSPHFTRYDFESSDARVKIYILINNSANHQKMFQYNLRNSYVSALSRRDLMVDYKLLKSDKYFVSGNLTNGKILYEFAYTKNGYGYTYSIEYDRSYKVFFDKNLNDIIKGFRILYGAEYK
jgi:hypothetical protein